MDLRQQAKNVAKAGRYGDSMLLHVNPVEMKGLRQSLPITKNPKTGQDEAFLPFLAPLLGSIAAPALFTSLGGALGTGALGTALTTLGSKAALAGAIGSGLGTYAATGDLEKGIMSGLTGFGIGQAIKMLPGNVAAETLSSNAIDSATQSGQVLNEAALQNITDASTLAANQGAQQAALRTPIDNIRSALSPSVSPEVIAAKTGAVVPATAGTTTVGLGTPSMGDFAKGAMNTVMDPSVLYPTTIGATGTAMIEQEEQMASDTARLLKEEEERKRKYQEYYDNLIASIDNPAGFQTGGFTGFDNPIFALDGGSYGNFGDFGSYYDPVEPPFIPPTNNPPVYTPPSYNPLGQFPPNYQGGFQGERVQIPRINELAYDNQTIGVDPFRPSYDPGYNAFFNAPFYSGIPAVINPYSSFNPLDFMGNVAMPTPPVVPPVNPPINPPVPPISVPPIQVPPIDPPDEGIEPPAPDPVEPPVTQPGGPGVIDPGKQPPPITSIEYDPLSDPRIFDLINQRIESTIQDLGVPTGGFGQFAPRTDQDIQALIDQSISGIPQPTFNENELVDRLRNQFVSYDRLPDVIPEPVVGGSTFDPSDIYGQLGELRGQLSSLPQGGGRSDADIQALIDQSLQGFQPSSGMLPRSDEDIQALINQSLSGLPTYGDDFTSINQRLDELYNRPQFTPFDPSELLGQFGSLQNEFGQLQGQFEGINFDDFARRSDIVPPNFDDRFMSIDQQLSDLRNAPGFDISSLNLPDFTQFATQSDLGNLSQQQAGFAQDLGNLQGQFTSLPDFNQFVTQSQLPTMPDLSQFALQSQLFDPSGIQQQLGGLAEQQAGFAQNLGNLEGQFAGLPDFNNFARISDIQQMPDLSGIRSDISGLQGQFAGLPDFSQFALQSQIPTMPDMSQFALQSQLFDPSGIQSRVAGLEGQVNALPDFGQFALQNQIPQMPDMSQFALTSQIPQMPDFSQFVTQQGLSNALDPYALQTQIPQMPNMGQFALASQIPNVSNFVTSSQLANSLLPYAFRSEIPQFPTGSNFSVSQPSMQVPSYSPSLRFQEGKSTNVEENVIEGEIVDRPELTQDILDDPITKELMLFIAGDAEDDSIIQEFVTKYGPELFMQVRQMVLQQIMPDAQTEGMIKGSLEGGMADDIPMAIGANTQAAVSQDEYIVPADVVSMIGDGSSDAGAKKLDDMLDNVRLEKGGTTKQARPLKKDIEEYVG